MPSRTPSSFVFALTLTTLTATLFASGVRAETRSERPNIVFMFADDLGYGDLACYGHPYAETPYLDQLAAEGTRFTRFYVSGVTCCPSRTGFMTGVHCARFAKYPAGYGFGDRVTVTELLQQQGYRTGHFGKWHMGPETEGVYGIDEYDPATGDREAPLGRDANLYDAAMEFIKANKDEPFYVNIWGHITHYAVDAADELVARYADLKVDREDFSATMQSKFDESAALGDIDAAMREYLGEVWSLDAAVGRVLDTLEELDLRENTLVVFSSDHGPAPVGLGAKKETKAFSVNMLGYAGPLRGGKHDQYEGGVRVPFIARWPGHVAAGRVDDTSVLSGLDWLPTLAAIAGIEALPSGLDGEDVSAAWFGQARIRETPLFWRTSSPSGAPSVLEGDWKLHFARKSHEVELYDLSSDPSEAHNVAAQHPEVVERLSRATKAWVAELPTSYDKMEKDEIRKAKRTKREQDS